MRCRRWQWTLNNYNDSERNFLQSLGQQLATPLKFLCYGEEIGEQGTPHLQGYCEVTTMKSMVQMKTFLGSNRFHLAKAKGTQQHNILYCSKKRDEDAEPNEVYCQWGRVTSQGQRSDLEAIRELIRDGATSLEIADQYFSQWCVYRNSLNVYRTLTLQDQTIAKYPLESFPENWRNIVFDWTKTQIFWGESGIGKTEFAKSVLGTCLFVSHVDELTNYKPDVHQSLCFDDMDFKHTPRTSQIHLVDQDNPRSIHCRYTPARIPAQTKKIFTTNEVDGYCVDLSDPAIRRRVQVHHFIKL